MKKFEYQVLAAGESAKVIAKLNELGREGWELVQVDYPRPESGYLYVMFVKRELD